MIHNSLKESAQDKHETDFSFFKFMVSPLGVLILTLIFLVFFLNIDVHAAQLHALNFDAATDELKSTLMGKIAKTAQLVGVVGGGIMSIPAKSLKPFGGGLILAFGLFLAEKLFG